MTNHHLNTHATTNNNVGTNTGNFDWTSFIAQAMFEGGQAFLTTISSAAPDLDEAQLQDEENQMARRYAKALDNAKHARSNPGPHVLSAVRSWSRKQAIAILRKKLAGKKIRRDFYQPFQPDLQQEISTLIADLQLFWEQEDEEQEAERQQRIAAKRQEAEQAFGAAYPYIRGLSDAMLNGERQRQDIFKDGQNAVQKWAEKYEESVLARERQLETREERIEQQERENREHQLALRSLAKWDDKNSFVNTVVSTGKNTMGCLLAWLLLIVCILAAIYFAFPHK